MPKRPEQKVIVEENSKVDSITQIVNVGVPLILIGAVVGIAVVMVSGYDLRTLLVQLTDVGTVRPTRTSFENLVFEGCRLLDTGDIDGAEEKFNEANTLQPESAEVWYWKAEVAFARNKTDIAHDYVDEALRLDPNHYVSLALEIKLLLIEGNTGDAKKKMEQIRGISDELDQWLDCLSREGLFSYPYVTRSELETRCHPPVYEWRGVEGTIR
jgi:tetratricopeptide (TPR) repeat protein